MKVPTPLAVLFFFLFCSLAGAPAYEIYASINHESVESIIAEREESAFGESSSKRLRARRDLFRSPATPLLDFIATGKHNARLPAALPSLTWIPASHGNLHYALHVLRI